MKPNKYEPLGGFLRKQSTSRVPMTFSEIEAVIGDRLPNSAYRHRPWWSNNPSNSVMTKVWLDAGFQTEQVDMSAQKLVFKRVQTPSQSGRSRGNAGMSDVAHEFKPAEAGEVKSDRHPLIGSMKGTFTLVPPNENETPPEDPESWEALSLAKLDRLLFGKGE